VFVEFALSIREVEAAVRETSKVLDAVPRNADPDVTVKVSVLTAALLPAISFGVVIDREPVLMF